MRYRSSFVSLFVLIAACGKCSNKPAAPAPVPFPTETAAATPAAPAATRPNIILISIDTLRADHLPIYGYAQNTAPNIAKLARSSVVFDNAFAAHTNTAPSHATMLTGQYPGVHGVRQNGMKLAASMGTLGELLRQRGYATGAFVSGWTLTPHTGLDRGFDVYDANFSRSRRPGLESWTAADRWMRKQLKADKPFFLFLHLFEPHFAYDPPDEETLRFLPEQKRLTVPLDPHLPGLMSKKRLTPKAITEYTARYDAEIRMADAIVGKLMRKLKQLGRLDDALVIVTADHGETLFERPWIADHGGRAYDEQTRVPLVIQFPQREQRRKRVTAQVHHVDYLPTILDVLGEALPTGLPGRSLYKVARSRRLRETNTLPVFSHARPEPERVPEISAALVKTGIITAVRLPPFKLIEYPMAGGTGGTYFQQLFNIETDPGETNNVAVQHPEQLAQLHALLEKFRADTRTGDTAAPQPTLEPHVHEQLKSLGYVQ